METEKQAKSHNSRVKATAVDSKDVSVDSNNSVSFKPTDCQPSTETSPTTRKATKSTTKTGQKPSCSNQPDRHKTQYELDDAVVRRIAKEIGYKKVTELQVQWLVTYLSCDPEVKDSEVTERCGFHPKTVGRWWLKQQWVDLVVKVAESRARKGLPRVWKALEDKAASGDIRAIALYAQRFDGEFIRQTHAPAKTPEDKQQREAAQKAIRMAAAKKPGPKGKTA